jgi:hypothetical protein
LWSGSFLNPSKPHSYTWMNNIIINRTHRQDFWTKTSANLKDEHIAHWHRFFKTCTYNKQTNWGREREKQRNEKTRTYKKVSFEILAEETGKGPDKLSLFSLLDSLHDKNAVLRSCRQVIIIFNTYYHHYIFRIQILSDFKKYEVLKF